MRPDTKEQWLFKRLQEAVQWSSSISSLKNAAKALN
jgi:hypothetical protein